MQPRAAWTWPSGCQLVAVYAEPEAGRDRRGRRRRAAADRLHEQEEDAARAHGTAQL